jgi:uncharacterized protein YbjQ (UPF0145 family)
LISISSGYLPDVLVVTIDDLPGHQIRQIVGEVVGVTARPQNKFTEGARTLDGTLSAAGEQYLVAGRREAVERMAFHARAAGANAVLGMRFDHRVISETWVEICAYGTAVVAMPIRAGVPSQRRSVRPRKPSPELAKPALYEAMLEAETETTA